MQQVGEVLVIFSDNFRRHLTQELVKREIVLPGQQLTGEPPGGTQNFVEELMRSVVPRMVE